MAGIWEDLSTGSICELRKMHFMKVPLMAASGTLLARYVCSLHLLYLVGQCVVLAYQPTRGKWISNFHY